MTSLGAGLATAPAPTPTTTEAPATPQQPSGPPESYADWKVPEGFELDKAAATEAAPLFKELGLTQEQGQKLVDFYATHSVKAQKESSDALMKSWNDTRTQWRDELKHDDQIGKLVGSNGNFGPDSPLIMTVNKALDGLQNPKLVSAFKDAMELTGAGDNPAFVKVLYALASKVTEGSSYASGGPTPLDPKTGQVRGSRPSAGAALYPHLPSGQTG